MGLYEETAITGTEFSWLASMFYVGYLVFQIPNQYLIQRFPTSKYLGTCLVLWGFILGSTAFAHNFHQLVALRILQGFFEAAAYPCLFLLISTVYRRAEQIIWFGAIVGFNDFGTAIGGLLGYGFWNLDGVHGLRAWRWYVLSFLNLTAIRGGNSCTTAGIGIITFLFLPDTAKSRWYRLTLEEQDIVEERVRDNAVVQNKTIKLNQIVESLKEPRFYCFTLTCFLYNMVNGCVSIFSTTIINNMGFSNMESILLNIPVGLSSVFLDIVTVYLSHRFNENSYIGVLGSLTCFTGVLLLTVLPAGGAQLAGIFLTSTSPVSAMSIVAISNNTSGYTKKVFYNGAYFVACCLGNFIGPLLMRQEEAPRYLSGMTVYMAAMIVSGLLFLYVRWTYVRDNRRRHQLKEENKLPSPVQDREKVDLTDKQDLYFVYRP